MTTEQITVLRQILDRIDDYIGSLIDVADMSADDRDNLKAHLLAAQEILIRNGQRELQEFVGGITRIITDRF